MERRVDVGSMWGLCRVDVGSMKGLCKVDVGSMGPRVDGCRVGVGSMWLWMDSVHNKMKRRENNKILEEGIKN